MTNATFRTCWECNSAHEHLKSCPELVCIGCGNVYEKGVKIGSVEPMLATSYFKPLKQALEAGDVVKLENGEVLVIEDLDATWTKEE